MSWLGSLFSSGLSELTKTIGNTVDEFHLSKEEKENLRIKLESLLQKRDSEIEDTIRKELETKEKILVAELVQGDSYTKRARPTVVYAGLAFVLLNYVILPLAYPNTVPLELPGEFWLGWSGIVATWSIGRTVEKRGNRKHGIDLLK